MNEEEIKKLQKKLRNYGYKGEIDGIIGNGVMRALEKAEKLEIGSINKKNVYAHSILTAKSFNIISNAKFSDIIKFDNINVYFQTENSNKQKINGVEFELDCKNNKYAFITFENCGKFSIKDIAKFEELLKQKVTYTQSITNDTHKLYVAIIKNPPENLSSIVKQIFPFSEVKQKTVSPKTSIDAKSKEKPCKIVYNYEHIAKENLKKEIYI